MQCLGTEAFVKVDYYDYNADQVPFKVWYLNARSLHRHVEDIRTDLYYSGTDVKIFSETRFSDCDDVSMYAIVGYTLK